MENIPRIHDAGHLRKDSKFLWKIYIVNLSSSTTASYWIEKRNTEKCVQNSITIAKYARKFLGCRWSFLGPGSEKEWYGTYYDKPDGNWDRNAEMMMLQLHTESGHSTFRASSAFERGELRSKGHGKKSVHFNGSAENIELLLRTIISANQLSVHGAMADLCKELPKDSERSGKLEAPDHLETMEIPAGPHTNEQQQ